MKSLRADLAAVSEIVAILILAIVVIVVIAVVAGGFTLVLGVFFGGRIGAAVFLFFLAFVSLVIASIPQTRAFAKPARWGVYLFAFLGILFLILGVLGR